MGSPSLCYKKILRSYIEWNSYLTKYQEQFSKDYLLSLNEEELESLVKKFNYYDDDINMIYQAPLQKSGEALKNLAESLASSFAIANENINNQFKQFGITGKTLYEVLSQIADKWVDVSLAGYLEKDDLSGPGTSEETDKPNEKCDLEIFDENEDSTIFPNSTITHDIIKNKNGTITETASIGDPIIIKADNADNEFIIF